MHAEAEDTIETLGRRLWAERLLFLGAVAAAACVVAYPRVFPTAWGVYVDGQPVLAMRERETLERTLERVKQDAGERERQRAPESRVPKGVVFVQEVLIRRADPRRVPVVDAVSAIERLSDAVKLRAERAVIYVDGYPVVALADEAQARLALARVKAELGGEPRRLVGDPAFKQEVRVRTESVEQDLWADRETAEGLLKGDDGESGWVVKPGDTARAIARDHGITVEDLRRLNPGRSLRRLRAGDRLRVSASEAPLVTVLAEGRATRTRRTPFRTVVRHSPVMYRGKRILKQAGKAGRVRWVVRVRYQNGLEVSRETLRREVVARPRDKIVVLGAKPRPRRNSKWVMGKA